MRGKWAAGIEPRNFTWVFRERLAVSERPGGSTLVHRKVRRDEELLWLKHQGFTRIISILPAMSNLSSYTEHGLKASHYALRQGPEQHHVLLACYDDLHKALTGTDVVLLHGDEVSDRLVGVIAGYLIFSGRCTSTTQAITMTERLFRRSIGPDGRALLNELGGEA